MRWPCYTHICPANKSTDNHTKLIELRAAIQSVPVVALRSIEVLGMFPLALSVTLLSFMCQGSPPHGLTFTWWGCCGLCLWHKPTELARSFVFRSCVCFCLHGPSTLFHSISSPNNSLLPHSVLPVFVCLNGPFNCISFHESLPQPWYNPLWLTGLKELTY